MYMICAFNFIILDVIISFTSKFLNADLTSLTSSIEIERYHQSRTNTLNHHICVFVSLRLECKTLWRYRNIIMISKYRKDIDTRKLSVTS